MFSLVTSCDYSLNGNYFACTVDIANTAFIYDARTQNLLHSIKLESTPTTIEFSFGFKIINKIILNY